MESSFVEALRKFRIPLPRASPSCGILFAPKMSRTTTRMMRISPKPSRMRVSIPPAPGPRHRPVTAPRIPVPEGRPLVLGHRGASAEAPENTLAAFRRAMEQGADGFELDVWRCGSGEAVVVHDADTRRTGQAALEVRRTPLPVLRALDVGGWRGDEFRGERIPALGEVLDAFPAAVVNVEMKSGRIPDAGLAR